MKIQKISREKVVETLKNIPFLLLVFTISVLIMITTWVLVSERNYAATNIFSFTFVYLFIAVISLLLFYFARQERKYLAVLTLFIAIIGVFEIAIFKETNAMLTYDQWLFQGAPAKFQVKTLDDLVQKYSGVCNVAQMECREITPYVPPVSGFAPFDRYNYQIQIPREDYNIYAQGNQITINPDSKEEFDITFRNANTNVLRLLEIDKKGKYVNLFQGKYLTPDQLMQLLIQPEGSSAQLTSQTFNNYIFIKIVYEFKDSNGAQVKQTGYGIDLGDREILLLNMGIPDEQFEKSVMSSFTKQ